MPVIPHSIKSHGCSFVTLGRSNINGTERGRFSTSSVGAVVVAGGSAHIRHPVCVVPQSDDHTITDEALTSTPSGPVCPEKETPSTVNVS
eukprot:CAMPEP_0194509548 /NCGR_PEP_ID=MMETSP0253-20130528/40444_1 /TAXON_ID=2966 /ORGANISM="Noctiluca scintillans" /LENGTH=89 /DNA_ID=CAMNT_0039352711 /DNA_START=295 /DNA_END=564 /DNA_ORIENTATION=+